MFLLDAHVHIYDCFDLDTFLDHAQANFTKAARCLGRTDGVQFVIVLTDWARQRWFEALRELAEGAGASANIFLRRWTVSRTAESDSLVAEGSGGRVVIVAGRKVISWENLEVLALGATARFEDGKPIDEIISRIRELGEVAIVPWAAGKWMGSRGALLKKLVLTRHQDFFLCDNGNRPWFWPRSSLFSISEQMGRPVLAGSDPLHFSREARRVGRFGTYVHAKLSDSHPARDLKNLLAAGEGSFCRYGKLERFPYFLANQFAMQVLKRKNRKELLDR